MATLKRRYYTWLIKAYFKKMGRTIISSAILGILIFFAIIGLLNYYFRPLLFKTTENVGYTGTYTVQTLPQEILKDISYGLTIVEDDGQVKPAAAASWSIKDEKVYTFKIKPGIRFHNGEELTSDNLNYNFEDVTYKVIDKYTVSFTLKNAYSPFLTTVARPVFGSKLEGIGRYKVENIELNAGFVKSLTLEDTQNKEKKRKIFFYPTQKALKVAFMLGEVSTAYGVTNTSTDVTDLAEWSKVKVEGSTDYSSLVAIFYNTKDSVLGDPKVRQALNYALPGKVENGVRAYGPIPPTSIYYSQLPNYEISDLDLAKTLFSTVEDSVTEPFTISTTPEYEKVALDVQKAWEKLGVQSRIKIVQGVPTDFQVFIYRMKLPQDPDQYVLWHSNQANNITRYDHDRINKLLEDGRSISDVEERKKIYADFQKYLVADVPASFYYFPTVYNIHKN